MIRPSALTVVDTNCCGLLTLIYVRNIFTHRKLRRQQGLESQSVNLPKCFQFTAWHRAPHCSQLTDTLLQASGPAVLPAVLRPPPYSVSRTRWHWKCGINVKYWQLCITSLDYILYYKSRLQTTGVKQFINADIASSFSSILHTHWGLLPGWHLRKVCAIAIDLHCCVGAGLVVPGKILQWENIWGQQDSFSNACI